MKEDSIFDAGVYLDLRGGSDYFQANLDLFQDFETINTFAVNTMVQGRQFHHFEAFNARLWSCTGKGHRKPQWLSFILFC